MNNGINHHWCRISQPSNVGFSGKSPLKMGTTGKIGCFDDLPRNGLVKEWLCLQKYGHFIGFE